MATLTAKQVATYARDAGFKQPALSVMVAVAFAESGFRTDARNPNSTATGLWQILASHKQFAGWDLTDPAVNARAAKKLWDDAGQGAKGFTPWKSSENVWSKPEALRKGMEAVAPGSSNDLQGKLENKIPSTSDLVPDALEGSADALGKIGDVVGWLSSPGNWQRVAYIWLGGMLIVVGAALIAAPVTKPVMSTVAKVTPIGKVGKLL